MTKPVKLPVVRLGQKPGLCGAASAQMILNAKGKVGKTKAIEDQLWDEIKANTTPAGSLVVPSAPPCGTFANQVTEACKPDALCWCTYPDALATTINDHLGNAGVSVVLDKDPTGLGLTARIVASISSGIAPAVLVHDATHWVVVYGFLAGGPPPPCSLEASRLPRCTCTIRNGWRRRQCTSIEGWTSRVPGLHRL